MFNSALYWKYFADYSCSTIDISFCVAIILFIAQIDLGDF